MIYTLLYYDLRGFKCKRIRAKRKRKLKGSDLFTAKIVLLGASRGLLECSIPTSCSQGKESGLAPGCQPVVSQKGIFYPYKDGFNPNSYLLLSASTSYSRDSRSGCSSPLGEELLPGLISKEKVQPQERKKCKGVSPCWLRGASAA